MPGLRTEITEIATALGTLGRDLDECLDRCPAELTNVPHATWDRIVAARRAGDYAESFRTAFENGAAFLEADDGLRRRVPQRIEWKGPHRSPGDDVIPADLRIDHVYLVSCKYLSKVLVNSGPSRLFDRSLAGDQRAVENWFGVTAEDEYLAFYRSLCAHVGLRDQPGDPRFLTAEQQLRLKQAFADRALPAELQTAWCVLSRRVAEVSSTRWRAGLSTPRSRLRLLWRLLRVSNATYFVLGTDRAAHLRLRVCSTWDWNHDFDLRTLDVEPREAGQPEVAWYASVRDRTSGDEREIVGHVEIRWSHGRFVGAPEAKVYLDTPLGSVAGYVALGRTASSPDADLAASTVGGKAPEAAVFEQLALGPTMDDHAGTGQDCARAKRTRSSGSERVGRSS